MTPIAPFETRETRLLAAVNPSEEGLVGLVEPCQHVLQHMGVDGGVGRHGRSEVLQLGFLRRARDGAVAALVGGDALLQGRVGERAAVPDHCVQRRLRSGRWTQLLFERLAHALAHRSRRVCAARPR